VIRRSKLDYKAGYDQGYLQPPGRWDAQGFDSGLLDGLNELVTDGLIDRQAVRQITQNHPRIIQYPTGWDNDFDLYASASEQQQDGMTAGQGMGFDQGYEEALARYGYSRKYSAIPAGNILTAQGDNGGICVYCNNNPIQDIDHVYPLKEHWRRKGATMQQAARSAEANHIRNLVGACANCNRSKGSKLLRNGWNPPAWGGGPWWPYGPPRALQYNNPGPYWPP